MDRFGLSKAAGFDVSRETFDRLEQIEKLIRAEAGQQNLISSRTADDIWSRHIIDSVQLLRWANGAPWLDLGTGAGFPGLVIAAFGIGPVILVEQRRLRHEFLTSVIEELGMPNVSVSATRLERVETFAASTISARAFAPLERLLNLSHRFSTEKTRWVLPKGRSAREELESVRATWHGDFRLEQSLTDPESAIILAEHVRPRVRQ